MFNRIMKSFLLTMLVCLASGTGLTAQPVPEHNLQFGQLAAVWDEAIPLGNGTVGALIWQKDNQLRFSLDRVDIWDMRPMKGLHREEFSFQWVQQQVLKNDYEPVQRFFDAPYDREPAPSKIPAGALEFQTVPGVAVKSVKLILENALCEVEWEDGSLLKSFVHATLPVGWFRFENRKEDIGPSLVPPPYQGKTAEGGTVNSLVGDDLSRLGYKDGRVEQTGNSITYTQEGWGGFVYQMNVQWRKIDNETWEGAWSVSSHYPDRQLSTKASETVGRLISDGFQKQFQHHTEWWQAFWQKSDVHIPDPVLEKQWYLEKYKFGSTARAGAPPISLQAVWTADNGRIPPWKGDFHHDLNTQLSYWPAYSGNHLEEAMGYLDHLDENKENYKRYTRRYFGKDGLAVPGVTTLDGTEMGGWIQYSLSPTVSAWLAQHYYLQWRYSMDKEFLKERAYPWFKEVCTFLEAVTVLDEKGLRKLPISSSPEINDNKITAWFLENTNYDLSLMKFAFQTGAELAGELGYRSEQERWQKLLSELGDYALTAENELMFAPSLPYNVSHRHFSHLMAIHPLGLIRWEDGEKAQSVITHTIRLLEKTGPDYWCGYSYSWLGNLKARAKDGEGAAAALRIFASAFCLPNSFHANGDQTKSGYSKFTYRPFTLEGNFAFAAGIQEMLLQSYAGFIEIMPAVPADWQNVTFNNLRAEGAFLISARKADGQIREITLVAEKDGVTQVKIPFEKWEIESDSEVKVVKSEKEFLILQFGAGSKAIIKNTDK